MRASPAALFGAQAPLPASPQEWLRPSVWPSSCPKISSAALEGSALRARKQPIPALVTMSAPVTGMKDSPPQAARCLVSIPGAADRQHAPLVAVERVGDRLVEEDRVDAVEDAEAAGGVGLADVGVVDGRRGLGVPGRQGALELGETAPRDPRLAGAVGGPGHAPLLEAEPAHAGAAVLEQGVLVWQDRLPRQRGSPARGALRPCGRRASRGSGRDRAPGRHRRRSPLSLPTGRGRRASGRPPLSARGRRPASGGGRGTSRRRWGRGRGGRARPAGTGGRPRSGATCRRRGVRRERGR